MGPPGLLLLCTRTEGQRSAARAQQGAGGLPVILSNELVSQEKYRKAIPALPDGFDDEVTWAQPSTPYTQQYYVPCCHSRACCCFPGAEGIWEQGLE